MKVLQVHSGVVTLLGKVYEEVDKYTGLSEFFG